MNLTQSNRCQGDEKEFMRERGNLLLCVIVSTDIKIKKGSSDKSSMTRDARLRLILLLAFFFARAVNADPTLFLSDALESANVRSNLAQEAHGEVIAAYFIVEEDRTGLTMLTEMRDAARKGKRTILVLDALASRVSKEALAYLDSEGVEIYHYNPFNWKKPFEYLRRFHWKIFLADGTHLVTGDRNVGDHYFGLSDKSYLSRDVYVQGKAARDARDQIMKLIASGEVRRFKGKALSYAELKLQRDKFDLINSKKLTSRLRERTDWKTKVFESDAVEFIHDPVVGKGKVPGMEQNIIEAIDRAKSHITIENAYVVLPESLERALERAAKRGVKIHVISNSVASTNAKLVAMSWGKSRSFLASIGAEIWEHPGQSSIQEPKGKTVLSEKFRRLREFFGPMQAVGMSSQTLHAKTMRIDEADSYIMSYNFDPRSEKINLETAVHIKGEKFAKLLDSEIESDIARLKYKLVASNGKLLLPKGTAALACVLDALARALNLRQQL